MNEALKGFRTIIVAWSALLIGSVDVINDSIQQISEIVGMALSDGGAVAALTAVAVSIKQVITDTIPKIRG